MTDQELHKIDHAAMKTSQVTIILLNILAFVLDFPALALFVAVVMLIGVWLKVPGFGFIYKFTLRPLGLVRPDVLLDNPEPHRFAQLVGGLFMSAGSAALFAGATTSGWSLVWIVAALAALNAFGGFCVGCAMYYWLARLNVPGFRKTPPQGTFPGMRPKGLAADES